MFSSLQNKYGNLHYDEEMDEFYITKYYNNPSMTSYVNVSDINNLLLRIINFNNKTVVCYRNEFNIKLLKRKFRKVIGTPELEDKKLGIILYYPIDKNTIYEMWQN